MSAGHVGTGSGPLPIVAAAREACAACPYYPVCPLAPLFLQVEAPRGSRKPHPHARTLEMFLDRLRRTTPTFERDLLALMNGDDEGLALISGCLLATQYWEDPERLARLLQTIQSRAARGNAPRELSKLEEQLQRAAAIGQHQTVPSLLRGPFRLHRPDREVSTYEAIRLLSRLVDGESPALWWNEAVVEEDRPAFEASFALRDKTGDGDESQSSSGSLDLFFSARAPGKSVVFYYRRDGMTGKQALVPVESVRADSLLKRMVKVFDTDAKKTHRLFAKICRSLNNGYRQLDKKMLWVGLKQLDKEHLVVLAMYAPRLARFVEKRAEFPGLYRLVKFLHVNVADDDAEGGGEGLPSHAKVYERRAQVGSILELYGKEPFAQLCRAVFRIAEAYRPGPASSDLIYKIGEVAYLLTAVQGFNARGLELSLTGRNPLAYIAYGLQPPAPKDSGGLGYRYRRMIEARGRLTAANGNGNGHAAPNATLVWAIDQGLAYMAATHGFETTEALAKAAQAQPAGPQGMPGAAPR